MRRGALGCFGFLVLSALPQVQAGVWIAGPGEDQELPAVLSTRLEISRCQPDGIFEPGCIIDLEGRCDSDEFDEDPEIGVERCPGYGWVPDAVHLQNIHYESSGTFEAGHIATYRAHGRLTALSSAPGFDKATATIRIVLGHRESAGGGNDFFLGVLSGALGVVRLSFQEAKTEHEFEAVASLAEVMASDLDIPEVCIDFEDTDSQNNLGANGFFEIRRIVVEWEDRFATFIRGDVNSDGEVDIADAIFQLNAMFRNGPLWSCREAADVNGDTRLDISDVVYSLVWQHRGGAAPPSPGPITCGLPDGVDPADLDCAGSAACPSQAVGG